MYAQFLPVSDRNWEKLRVETSLQTYVTLAFSQFPPKLGEAEKGESPGRERDHSFSQFLCPKLGEAEALKYTSEMLNLSQLLPVSPGNWEKL